jgi:hypothetical protein
LEFVIDDTSSSTGAKLTGVLYSAITASYIRSVDSAPTAIALVQGTVGTYSSGGFAEVSPTIMPGLYQLCVPDAAFASGDWAAICIKGASNMAPIFEEIQLVAFDDQSANVTVGAYAAGEDPGTLVLDAQTSDHAATGSVGKALGLSASGGVDTTALTSAIWSAPARSLTDDLAVPGDAMTLADAAYDRIAAGILDAKTASFQQTGSVGAAITQPAAVTVDANAIATTVWSAESRSLTTFGTLIADIWAYSVDNVRLVSASIGKYIADMLTNASATHPAQTPTTDAISDTGELTLDAAKAMLKVWMDAEVAVAVAGQSYMLNLNGNKREMTRANLAEIQIQIKFWQRKVRDLGGKRGRVGFMR